MYDRSNVFAKILKGEVKSKKIYENDFALVFFNIFPKAKIHALVIPKGYYENLTEFLINASINEKEGFLEAIKETLNILDIKEDGYRIISNNGVNGGQEIPHLHFHILAGEKLTDKV